MVLGVGASGFCLGPEATYAANLAAILIAMLAAAVTQSPALSATRAALPPMPIPKVMKPKVTLQPVPFADLPGWKTDDHLAAFETFLKSCRTVIKAAKADAGDAGANEKRAELAKVCRAALALQAPTRATAREFFEAHFMPYQVAHELEPGFLTGYYEPVLKGSRTAEGRYQVPIYRRPPDLMNVVDETQRASKNKGLTHVRKTAKGVEPYPTRAEIEKGALAGQGLELLYLEGPVDTFFMHVQGSGCIKLTDGTTVRLNYDGKNGHPYTSIGRYLVKKQLFPADKMSLDSLGRWLRADPARGRKVMWQNASFIFFRELKGREAEGAMGAMSVALTPGRSLAVDTAFHTLGSPIYVAAPTLKHATGKGGFNRLMVAQDVGSAIKGPERGDIYFGSGAKAGKLAGITSNPGNFFVLLPATAQSASRSRERLPWQKKKIEKAAR